MRALRLALVALLVPVALASQAPIHRVPRADTLRWLDVKTSQTTTSVPVIGETRIETTQRGTVALARITGDTGAVWYEDVQFNASSSSFDMPVPIAGAKGPPTRFIIRDGPPVRLADAASALLMSAGLSDETRRFALQPDFDRYLVSLPKTPLAIGVSWVDSVAPADSANTI
nr:hypothetical protein [Gemmatimonadaceae bacterium]